MPNKAWQGNFFEDFVLEQKVQCPIPRTITHGDVANYIAFTGDRTPRFCGPSDTVHPLVTFHAVFAQTVRTISLNARANLGYAGIRWLAPVKVGDTLSIELQIVGLKENSSKTTGIVYVHNVAKNQRGEEILAFWRWVMVHKKGSEPTPYLENPVIPSMPKMVEANQLVVMDEAHPSASETGGRWAFEDYQVGERIFHYDGITVNQSDHMSFTRLFQNSAKVHFDAMRTDGKPLVYGGVPISYGYAVAFNGLENRLGICGINAGSHTNPVYTGDTLYTFTEVLDKVELPDAKVGALRLRMIIMKNEDPTQLADPENFSIMVDHPKKPGRKRHHPSVVLDLDYWDMVPLRSAL